MRNRLKKVELGRRSEVIRDLLVHTKEWEEYREIKDARQIPAPDAKMEAGKAIQAFKTKGHKRAVTMLEGLPSPAAVKQLLTDMTKLTAMDATEDEQAKTISVAARNMTNARQRAPDVAMRTVERASFALNTGAAPGPSWNHNNNNNNNNKVIAMLHQCREGLYH